MFVEDNGKVDLLCCVNCSLKAHGFRNGVSKSIVHVIKHDNFQLHRVHPDGVILKTWQLMTNL